jgi:hypothetical protein
MTNSLRLKLINIGTDRIRRWDFCIDLNETQGLNIKSDGLIIHFEPIFGVY